MLLTFRSLTKRILYTSLYLTRFISITSSYLSKMNTVPTGSFSYIDARTAQLIDDRLMNQQGFSIDQLMELAGYSVANAAHDLYIDKFGLNNPKSNRNILIFCGPGNNGGDGLVAARHLKHFGYTPAIIYPKQGKSALFVNLVKQCIDLEIEILSQAPTLEEVNSVGLVIDGLFGFSFQGPVRNPYDTILRLLKETKAPVLAIDLPSGWDVNDGDIHQTGFLPDAVISLTLPKNCMKTYHKIHYLGGRFVPPSLSRELGIIIPDYGYSPTQVVKIENSKAIEDRAHNHISDEAVVMYTSAPSLEEAKSIANTLVKGKIAACVNIIPQVVSVFEWDGKIDNSNEILLMIKTKKHLAPTVTQTIKRIHSYQLPESIVMNIQNEGSNPEFVKWILDSTLPTQKDDPK